MRNREKAVNVVLSLAFLASPVNTEALLDYGVGRFKGLREQMSLTENSVCWGMATRTLEEFGPGDLDPVQKRHKTIELFNIFIASGKFRVYHD